MLITETFRAWADQIDVELAEATQAADDARADLIKAKAAHASAVAERDDVQGALAATGRDIPPTFARLRHPLDDAARQAEGGVVRAKGTLKHRLDALKDLEAAREELVLLTAPPAPEPMNEEQRN